MEMQISARHLKRPPVEEFAALFSRQLFRFGDNPDAIL